MEAESDRARTWDTNRQTSLDNIIKCFRHIRDVTNDSNADRFVAASGTSQSYPGEMGCRGHWVECLRIIGELENDHAFLDEAERETESLRPYLDHDDVFRAYRFYFSAARQYAWTGNSKYRTLALAAAYAVRSTAIPMVGMMPADPPDALRQLGFQGKNFISIHTVHASLTLDWWAYKETSDPVFLHGAKQHLDAVADFLLLKDGSTLTTGSYVMSAKGEPAVFTILGAREQCCWSEGQAWAIAGYLRAYEETNEEKYLVIGRRLLLYWVAHCDNSLMPPYNFEHPRLRRGGFGLKDLVAAAIVVEQLARLAVQNPEHPVAQECIALLSPMLEGLLTVLLPPDEEDTAIPGPLAPEFMDFPEDDALRRDVTFTVACLLFALYYLKSEWVVG